MKLKRKDRTFAKAYIKWYLETYDDYPSEYEVSQLIDIRNHDLRYLIEDLIYDYKINNNRMRGY
jgi:hypothetical protein